jgi:dihydroorotate dehydrogenase (fumarate)
MIDLTTSYLGLPLSSPLVCSSSPLCETIDNLRRMEFAGAGAVVLHSLFEEQLTLESLDLNRYLQQGTESYAEALSYFPDMREYNLGPEGYLEHIQDARRAVNIPIIASLNGATPGGWVQYAQDIERAGADALELNIYYLPTDPAVSGAEVEQRYVDLVAAVAGKLHIPVAVKLSPYFSAPASLARRLADAGAAGLVLFNRFYQPDFNLDTLDVEPSLKLSRPEELLLRLHWVAILYGQVGADLAVTGGVHTAADVLKCMMAGASAAMLTSALLKNGIDYLQTITKDLVAWMEAQEYESIRQMQGSMSLEKVADPAAFERANYMKVLGSYALKSVGYGA